jgi:hypothetical protein
VPPEEKLAREVKRAGKPKDRRQWQERRVIDRTHSIPVKLTGFASIHDHES